MSMTAGATGMLHHLVRQWAAGIGRSLDMIVEVLLMLVENVLGAADGGKARSHGAAGGSAAREGKPAAAPHRKRAPWLDPGAAAQNSQDLKMDRICAGAAPGSASHSIAQFGAGGSRYGRIDMPPRKFLNPSS